MDAIVLNVEFERNGEPASLANEIQVVPPDISWKDLEAMLKVYADCEEITVLYLDEDDDHIQINSQMEIEEAFRVARNNQNMLRLIVLSSEPKVEGACASGMEQTDGEPMKYFYLKNEQQNLVLDVEAFGQQRGTPVILWEKKPYEFKYPNSVVNQLWYEDAATQTLRTAMNGFCLDLNGDRLVICDYNKDAASQKWKFDGQFIRKLSDVVVHGQRVSHHVVGVKSPDVAGPGCSLYAGPEMALNNVSWVREYFDLDNLHRTQPLSVPGWLPVNADKFRQDIVTDLTNAISTMFATNAHLFAFGQQLPPPPPPPRPAQNTVRHARVFCDNCECNIVGIRYKCGFCPNYDLCSDCERKQPPVHDPSHGMLRMALPIGQVQLKRQLLENVLSRSGSSIDAVKFEAQFLRDETIPDGSVVAPGAKLKKIWILRNVGSATWTPASTVLRLVSGTVFVTTETPIECQVPPGSECPVSAELVAPQPPGSYTSHWRLIDKESQMPFGPVIWCQINVDCSLAVTSVSVTGAAEIPPPAASPALSGGGNNGIDVALSTEDLFMFVKTLEKTTKKSKPSSGCGSGNGCGLLAVPTNTPLAATPPQYTPAAGLSRVSSNDSINNMTEDAGQANGAMDINMAVMADLVKDKMNELSSPIENDNNYDNIDVASEQSSDDSFYVVPIPDCFNTDLPPSKLASQSLILRKDSSIFVNASSCTNGDSGNVQSVRGGSVAAAVNACEQKSFSSSFASSDFVTTLLKPEERDDGYSLLQHVPNSPAKSSVVFDDVVDDDDDNSDGEQHHQSRTPIPLLDPVNIGSALETPAPIASVASWEQTVTESFRCENFGAEPAVGVSGSSEVEPLLGQMENSTSGTVDEPVSDDDDDESDDDNNAIDGPVEEPAAAEPNVENEGACGTSKMPAKQASLEDMALTLLATTVDATCKAATSAFRTVKDVYNTLQAKNSYVPPQSDWCPTESAWIPPPSTYSPPQTTGADHVLKSNWSPPRESTWVPSTYTPPTDDDVWDQPAPTWNPPSGTNDAMPAFARSPMDALIEMGFANRSVNEALLRKHNGDIDKVVQDLVNGGEQDWPMNRH